MNTYATAAIHHRHAPTGAEAEAFIAVAVDGELTGLRRVSDDPAYPLKFHLADAFRSLWERHRDTGLILYVSDPTVRKVLQEAEHDNLQIRSIATGRLAETVQVACSAAGAAYEDLVPVAVGEKKPRKLVIATDTSKGKRGMVGIGAASSCGRVVGDMARAKSVLEGEFAAVTAALKRWGTKADEIDLLTDSTKVVHILNMANPPTHYGEHQAEAIKTLRSVREHTEVRIHWVRGHNGHLLNDLADRAAVTTRRCTEFQTDNVKEFFATFREELAGGLAGIDPAELVPAPHPRTAEAA